MIPTLLQKESVAAIPRRLRAVCTRFPISILMVLTFTVCALCVSHDIIKGYDCRFFAMFYPASAALLGTAVHLWQEQTTRRLRSWGVQAVAQIAWLAYMIYFVSQWEPGIIRLCSLIALMIAMVVAAFLGSFVKEKTDLALWHFTLRTLLAALVAGAVSAVLTGGINLLLESLRHLFSFELWPEIWADVAAVCGGLVMPVLFLQLLPQAEAKHDRSTRGLPKWGYAIIRYIFLPLVGAYLLTLYVYAGKILLQWQLPDGWVAWLVTVLMLMMVLMLTALYPARFSADHRMERHVTRWLPVLVLPLLVLMTVGIVRRISDYGITVPRLYLALFNLWCYGVCLWLIWRRGSRLAWIPATFALLLLLASVGPQSFARITRHTLQSKVMTELKAQGIDRLPLHQDDLKTWLRHSSEAQRQTMETLHYLTSTYKAHELTQLVDSTTMARINEAYYKEGEPIVDIHFYANYQNARHSVPLPAGRSRMTDGYFPATDVRRTGDTIRCNVTIYENDSKRVLPLAFSYSQLKALKSGNNGPALVVMPTATIYIDDLTYTEDAHNLNFTGFVFY